MKKFVHYLFLSTALLGGISASEVPAEDARLVDGWKMPADRSLNRMDWGLSHLGRPSLSFKA